MTSVLAVQEPNSAQQAELLGNVRLAMFVFLKEILTLLTLRAKLDLTTVSATLRTISKSTNEWTRVRLPGVPSLKVGLMRIQTIALKSIKRSLHSPVLLATIVTKVLCHQKDVLREHSRTTQQQNKLVNVLFVSQASFAIMIGGFHKDVLWEHTVR